MNVNFNQLNVFVIVFYATWFFQEDSGRALPREQQSNSQPFGDQCDLQVLLAQEETEYVVSWERKSVTIYQAQLPLFYFYYRKKNTHLDCNCPVFYNFIIVNCCIDLLGLVHSSCIWSLQFLQFICDSSGFCVQQ